MRTSRVVGGRPDSWGDPQHTTYRLLAGPARRKSLARSDRRDRAKRGEAWVQRVRHARHDRSVTVTGTARIATRPEFVNNAVTTNSLPDGSRTPLEEMGWMTGLEPATPGATVQCSTN